MEITAHRKLRTGIIAHSEKWALEICAQENCAHNVNTLSEISMSIHHTYFITFYYE